MTPADGRSVASDSLDMAKALADMALELEEHRAPGEVLQQVSEHAQRLLGADAVGVMRTHSRREVETPAATSDLVDRAHQLQARFDEGPCLDAIEGRATYLSVDVVDDDRWPQWGPAAAAVGIRSTVGVRLATRGRGYGSLNVYSGRVGAFTSEHAALAEVLAAHASAAFAAVDREQGLRAALESRTTIGQAQGILMQTFEIDGETAFAFLKRISQHENTRLHDLAEAIAVQRDANARPR